MLRKSIKTNHYIFLVAIFIFVFISYDFAIKDTIAAWKLNQQLEERVVQGNDITNQPLYNNRKLKNLDRIINSYYADTLLYRSSSVEIIALMADRENIKFANVPVMDISYQTENTSIQKLEFEGDFFSLLKFIKKLEETKGVGMIRGEDWRISKSTGGNNEPKKIILDVYLEIIKKI